VCTLILLHRPHLADTTAWPLLLAANRDEMLARPWLPPATHWPEQPDVIGGLDTLGGGTWLATSEAGVVAGVLNRTGSLGPQPGKRSRGELPLLALRHPTADAASSALMGLNAADWRSFNLIIADSQTAYFIRGLGSGAITSARLAPGLIMIASSDPNDMSHPRVARHFPRFQSAEPPNPPDWGTWPTLLAYANDPPETALRIPPTNGFGTVSSTLIAMGPGRTDTCFFVPP
jgi:uncharacterized protein with NRDE domain